MSAKTKNASAPSRRAPGRPEITPGQRVSQLAITLPDELHARLIAFAGRGNCSKVIREWIQLYCPSLPTDK